MLAVQPRLHRPFQSPLLLNCWAFVVLFACLACHTTASASASVPQLGFPERRDSESDGESPQSPDPAGNSSDLPYHIGAIAGAYGASLVLVTVLILILSKNRREALSNGASESEFQEESKHPVPNLTIIPPHSPRNIPRSPVRNFSWPSPEPDRTEFFPSQSPQTPYVAPSPSSTLTAPGVDLAVDQRVVATDRQMAQAQLEEMYKQVMEHEEAKAQGREPPPVASLQSRPSESDRSSNKSTSTLSKRERARPAQLNLSQQDPERADGGEKTQSRTSSILSALRSPRKKNSGVKGVNISSPMMTPQSASFNGGHEPQEMNPIPPRHYAPAPPPPVPTDQVPFGLQQQHPRQVQPISPITPNESPESTLSIDERIGGQLPVPSHRRNASSNTFNGFAPSEADPISAVSENSQAPLVGRTPSSPKAAPVGLPSSPKAASGRFPPLPSSPRQSVASAQTTNSSFRRANAPSAVRTGGALPLRAYEPPAVTSPTNTSQTPRMVATKETTFERAMPLSPMTARTPATGVPYSPYQPFTPCVPMTPSLITKADRKRMKKLEPKTPTLEMVQSTEDVW